MSEHSCWGLLWNTWEVSLRLHKYDFVLLNRLRIATIAISSNPKIVKNREKCAKMGFAQNAIGNTLLHTHIQLIALNA